MKFSIPYNGDLELMRWAAASGKVYEVYFAGAIGTTFTTKTAGSGQFPLKAIERLLKFCRTDKIETNLLLNKSVLFFENFQKIYNHVRRLQDFGALSSITIGDGMIVPYLKAAFPGVRLQSSEFLHIDSVNKAKEALKMGISDLGLDVSTNRDGFTLDAIKAIKKYYPGCRVVLLANPDCYHHCFFASAHEHWAELRPDTSVTSPKRSQRIMGHNVQNRSCHQGRDLADEIKRPFIRPEDLSFYAKNRWADGIRIVGRADRTDKLRHKLAAYFEGKYFGNLFDIIFSHRPMACWNRKFPETFIEKVVSCRLACEQCRYCTMVAGRVLEKSGEVC